MQFDYKGYIDEHDRMRTENVRLRALVRDLWLALWSCDDSVCPRASESCDTGHCAIEESMRGLGVEVRDGNH